jgi:hypothetical protein
MAKYSLEQHLAALAQMGVPDAGLQVVAPNLGRMINAATPFHAIPNIPTRNDLAVQNATGPSGITHGGVIPKTSNGIIV